MHITNSINVSYLSCDWIMLIIFILIICIWIWVIKVNSSSTSILLFNWKIIWLIIHIVFYTCLLLKLIRRFWTWYLFNTFFNFKSNIINLMYTFNWNSNITLFLVALYFLNILSKSIFLCMITTFVSNNADRFLNLH